MNQQDKNLFTRLFDKYIKDDIQPMVSSGITSQQIEDQTEELGVGYAVLDTFLGACGIGIPIDKPNIKISRIRLQNPGAITASLDFPGGDDCNEIDITFTIGSFEMAGNFLFSQECVQFLPPHVNSYCATTNYMNMLADTHGGDIDSDENLQFLRDFRDKLQKTELGRIYLQKYNENEQEMSDLLQNNETVKNTFNSLDGLALFNNVLQVARGDANVVLESGKLSNALPAMGMALTRFGSPRLRAAVAYIKQQIPQYEGMGLQQILAKIEEASGQNIDLAQSGPAGVAPSPEWGSVSETANVSAPLTAGPGRPNLGGAFPPRTKSGSFQDTVDSTSLVIKGTMDFSGDKPKFSLLSSNPISVTIGKVDVNIYITVTGGETPTQGVGDILALMIAKIFGPGKTEDQIDAYFTGDTFKANITGNVNDLINKYWPL